MVIFILNLQRNKSMLNIYPTLQYILYLKFVYLRN